MIADRIRGTALAAVCITIAGVFTAGGAAAVPCTAPDHGIGVARVVEIDTSGGPIYGAVTRYARQESFLHHKEVVLTFDDGPAPATTRAILATLDAFCTKATFFEVGRMAIEYPSMVREVLARGHTVGTHTWSHPLSLGRLKPDAARDEIERGIAAVTLAAGRPIAPFFRFPGLGDTEKLLTHLQSRGIATFSVDVVSNDSFIGSAERLIKTTLERVEQRQGGIILFHDIKQQTAKALPVILTELKARGYKVVHVRAGNAVEPEPMMTLTVGSQAPKSMTALTQATGVEVAHTPASRAIDLDDAAVVAIAPPARPIQLAAHHGGEHAGHDDQAPRNPIVYGGAWNATVRRPRVAPHRTETN